MDSTASLVLVEKTDRNGITKSLSVVRADNSSGFHEAVQDLPAGDYKVMQGGLVKDVTVGYVTTQTNTIN